MWRDSFHVPGPGPYLLSHSVGCAPKTHEEALRRDFLQPWHHLGGDAWPVWLSAIEEFREALAALLGGTAADYCPQSNLSSGLAKMLPALPAAPGRPVLLAAEDSFPSVVYGLERAAGVGSETRLIPRTHDLSHIATWENALTTDVAVALVTQVHSNTGVVAPVREIAALCRARGIRCIVDIAQSAGILPVSIPEFGADVVLGSCVKWLCGGPGAGFMWIDPVLLPQLEPPDVGWFSHENPFEFDVRSFRYAPDARRFWGGTPSVVPYVLAADSLRLIAGSGSGRSAVTTTLFAGSFTQHYRPPGSAASHWNSGVVPSAWKRGMRSRRYDWRCSNRQCGSITVGRLCGYLFTSTTRLLKRKHWRTAGPMLSSRMRA